MRDHDETPDAVIRRELPRREALKVMAAVAASPLASEVRAAAQPAPARRAASVGAGRQQRFDADWRFLRADAPGAERPGFDDSAWRTLDLPHDFSVEPLPPRAAHDNGEGSLWGTGILPTRIGPFDTELSAGGRDTGWFVGGIGWYRKRFTANAVPVGSHVEIVFDGVYMNSDVWLNGTLLGNHPYGYTAFVYDLTPHLVRNGENVLAVRVRNEGRNSRWYSGSGIYRHVWLNTTGSVRVPAWGLFVTTPAVSRDKANVVVNVQVENRAAAAQGVTVRFRLLDDRGAVVGTRELTREAAAGTTLDVGQSFEVAAPRLWSPATPQLYRAEVELIAGGQTSDRLATSFGIRKVEVDAQQGLRINGEPSSCAAGACTTTTGCWARAQSTAPRSVASS